MMRNHRGVENGLSVMMRNHRGVENGLSYEKEPAQ